MSALNDRLIDHLEAALVLFFLMIVIGLVAVILGSVIDWWRRLPSRAKYRITDRGDNWQYRWVPEKRYLFVWLTLGRGMYQRESEARRVIENVKMGRKHNTVHQE